MSGQRGSNGFGPNAITFAEVEAWQRVCGITPKPWERRAIFAMDAAYRSAWTEASKEDQEGGEALTPDLLAKLASG